MRAVVATARAGQGVARGASPLALETPLDHFTAIRKKFDAAKISRFAPSTTASTTASPSRDRSRLRNGASARRGVHHRIETLTAAKRVVPFAEKHKMIVAMHNHSNIEGSQRVRDARELRRRAEAVEVFPDQSRHRPLHRRQLRRRSRTSASITTDITNLHIKDRKRNQGDNVPWGQGETPIREVLQLLKQSKWPIPRVLEYEYRGRGHAGRGSEESARPLRQRRALA